MPLTRSQRISISKTISERLEGEEWSLIDFTLSQFDIPTLETWSSDMKSYILEMVKLSSDHTLIELSQHLGYQIESDISSLVDPAF